MIREMNGKTVIGLAAGAFLSASMALVGGCPPTSGTSQSGAIAKPSDLDGTWLVQLTGSAASTGCLTIKNGQITVSDAKCDGLSDGFTIVTNPEASVSNGVVLLTLTQSSLASSRSYVYDLVPQSKDSLVGNLTFTQGTTPTVYQAAFTRRSGAATSQPADNTPQPINIDGDWRISFTDTPEVECLTVSSNMITTFDRFCDGAAEQLAGAQPVAISDKRAVLTFSYVESADTSFNYVFDVTQQTDGSFSGQVTITSDGAPVLSSGVVMTKQ